MAMRSNANGWQEAAELAEFEAMPDETKFRHLFFAYRATRADMREILDFIKGQGWPAWRTRVTGFLSVAAPWAAVAVVLWRS